MTKVKYDTILEEALEITNGARKSDYGDAKITFNKIAEIANSIGCTVSPIQVCKVLIAMKLTREANKHKRDNLTDLVGYTRLLSILEGDEDA